MKRVVVSQWCPSEAESRECLTIVLDDADEIDRALRQKPPWTSPDLVSDNAEDFRKCIQDCGGVAAIEEA